MEPSVKYELMDDMETNGGNGGGNNFQQQATVGHQPGKSPHTAMHHHSGGAYGELNYENNALTSAYDQRPSRNILTLQHRRERQRNDHQQQINQKARRPFPKSPKTRFIRGDSSLLFAPPFFQLEHNYNSLSRGDTLSARCHQCNVPIRGHKNVSSNFIKHLKRMHPKIYSLYESLKLQRMQGVGGGEMNPYGSVEQMACAIGECNDITESTQDGTTSYTTATGPPQDTIQSSIFGADNSEQHAAINNEAAPLTLASTANVSVDFQERQETTTRSYSSTDNEQQHVNNNNNNNNNNHNNNNHNNNNHNNNNTEAPPLTPETFEALIRRVFDEKLQSSQRQTSTSTSTTVYRRKQQQQQQQQHQHQKLNSREFTSTIERHGSVVSPVPSSVSSSSMSDASLSISAISDNSQQTELQEQLNSLQHDMRLLSRGQRRMQRQMIKMRKMLRRRTMVLDLGKAKKHNNINKTK